MLRRSNLPLIALCAAAACALAACAPRGPATEPDPVDDSWDYKPVPYRGPAPRITASRRELRVVFPRDTARSWGWSDVRESGSTPGYQWGVTVEGVDGPRYLSLYVHRKDWEGEGARRFASLAELVAAGQPDLCTPGMMGTDCTSAGVTASVENSAVVLSLRDSAELATLLGLRPGSATWSHDRPDREPTYEERHVDIRYVSPQVPRPDSSVLARGRAGHRRHEELIRTVYRHITAPELGPALARAWVAVGDSVRFGVEETRCFYDVCIDHHDAVTTDSAWTVTDTAIARPRPGAPSSRLEQVMMGTETVSLIALRPGTTTLRLGGLTGPGDTMPSSTPVARALEVEVVVVPPVARVRMTPRITRGRVGETIHMQAQAFDSAGRVVPGAPVEVRRSIGDYSRTWQSPLIDLSFDEPGRHVVTASFGGRVDTLIVDVEPGTATTETRKPSPRAARTDRDPAGDSGPQPPLQGAHAGAQRHGADPHHSLVRIAP